MGNGGRTVVGCVATAMSQVMKYWNWPSSGTGDESYQWDGDDSCDGSSEGWTLSTNFNHAYDWGNMANDYIWNNGWKDENGHPLTQANLDAVSVLCFETGVSLEMDYGFCGSEAWDTDIPYALADHFYYDSDANYFTPPMHDEIVNEITYLRPVVLSAWEHDWPFQGDGHCWVVYGYNESTNHLLMNMGWGPDSSHVWYFIGEVPKFHHEKRIIRYIAPTSIQFYQGYDSSNSGDGSPNDPFLSSIHYAAEETPDYHTLIFKAGETYNFYEDTLTINKPITLRGYNVVIEKG